MLPTEASSQGVVVVTGDVTVDWNIASLPDPRNGASYWSLATCSRAWWQRSGAALLADLVEGIAEALRQSKRADFAVRQMAAPRDPILPGDPRFHHCYALWSPFKYGEKPRDYREEPAWRVVQFMGLDRCVDDALCQTGDWKRIEGDTAQADVVVLNDANLGFRERSYDWPLALKDPKHKPWIIVKMAEPVAQGSLWEHLTRHFADRLIVVTTIDDLRRTEVQITRQLSWERTAQDLLWELTYNPRVNGLSRCAHAIVSFHTAGAILLSRQPDGRPQATLFFDPGVMEGDWERDHPGQMIGYTTCLTAALVSQVMIDLAHPELHEGTQSGVAAMRTLHLEGYGRRGTGPQDAGLRFPIAKVVSALLEDEIPLASARIQDPMQDLPNSPHIDTPGPRSGYWTILQDRYADSLVQVAEQIVLEGFDAALHGVPVGIFGALVTVDRREIEALHSIRSLIVEYCRRPQKLPLSIAVFGPPGSGKSFAVTQLAESARPGELSVLSFNLSQFESPDDLLDALHQVRDAGLSGKTPLVFWDEFDTSLDGKGLGWLRYFLAPMQDGAFQQGQITHPIGRCIFVFAGGTSHRMAEFGAQLTESQQRAVKLPDFVSRLKGFLDVVGPNPIEGGNDQCYVIRRAITLRSILERHASQIVHVVGSRNVVNIDRGVLRAFLMTKEYRHGVRSMESLVAMSMLAGEVAYERSNLPSEDQLNLHVDGRDFSALVQELDLTEDVTERLAEAAHEVFCEGLKAHGYVYGPQTDATCKTHSLLLPYEELPEDAKEQNRGNVRDMANKLAKANYAMLPSRTNEPTFDFPETDLELLARMEHKRYADQLMAAGWRYAPQTDRERKLHQTLLPWEDLPEEQREKDREFIRGIPRILAKAGYAIVGLGKRHLIVGPSLQPPF